MDIKVNKKAFTLIELLLALGLVVAMLVGSGYIFSIAAKSQKIAKATGDIMDQLRIVTDQIDRDFAGLQKDMPILIRFERYKKDEDGDGTKEVHRADQIMFFATGDFTSTRQYADKTNEKLISIKGDAERIQYAISCNKLAGMNDDYSNVRESGAPSRFLTRRGHILVSDRIIANELGLFPDINYAALSIDDEIKLYDSFFVDTHDERLEQKFEHENLSLQDWKQVGCNLDIADDSNANAVGNDFAQAVIPACFERFVDTSLKDAKGDTSDDKYARPAPRLHLTLSEAVSDLKIQLYYFDSVSERWFCFPSDDPDLNGNNSDSHFGGSGDYFDSANQDIFGISFNLEGTALSTRSNKDVLIDYSNRFEKHTPNTICDNSDYKWYDFSDFPLKAIKFTFTIRDPNGEFKEGKIFTHTVYLDN